MAQVPGAFAQADSAPDLAAPPRAADGTDDLLELAALMDRLDKMIASADTEKYLKYTRTYG